MSMEKNKHILEGAIRQLPQHQPPVGIWDSIAEGLDMDQQDAQWRSKLPSLPTYEAPSEIWAKIAQELPPELAPTTERKVIRLWPKIASAAAVIVLLLAGAWWQFSAKEKVEYAFSQETVSNEVLPEDWDQDDEQIASVMELAASSPLEKPEDFQRLKTDLEELNAARAELLELMEAYGKDPKVLREIGEIERQRSAVIKQVVTLI